MKAATRCIGGLSGGNRTPDPQLRRLLLYPTELRTDQRDTTETRKALNGPFACGNGRSGGIRTRDPLLPKQMRYQAALRSDCSRFYP